jgi:hypothetical protein
MVNSLRTKRRALLALVIALIVAGSISAGAFAVFSKSQSDTAGVSAGVGALDRLPPVSEVPSGVAEWVDRAAAATGTDPATARSDLREMRADLPLGDRRVSMYAFPERNGAVCFFVETVVSLCPNDPSAGEEGIQWVAGGGVPGITPRTIVAIVSDAVASASLRINSDILELKVVNNSIYAELPDVDPKSGTYALDLSYADGSSRTILIPSSDR